MMHACTTHWRHSRCCSLHATTHTPCSSPQGFYVRAVPSRFNADVLTMVEAKDLAVRAGMAFTIGLRLFYLFIVVVGGSGGREAVHGGLAAPGVQILPAAAE